MDHEPTPILVPDEERHPDDIGAEDSPAHGSPGGSPKGSEAMSPRSGLDRRRKSLGSLSLKSPGTFMVGAKDYKEVTRQQMIEYLTMQKWSRTSCRAAPLALALWLVLLALISIGSHTEASFRIRDSMTDMMHNLTADRSRGLAPSRTFTEAGADSISCKCSCAYERSAVCRETGDRNKRFEGDIALMDLQRLRARAAYNATEALSETKRWDDLLSIPDVWFWLQHGLLPEVWQEERHSAPVGLGSLFYSLGGMNDTAGRTPAGLLMAWNQIIGGVRLRTRRLKEHGCRVDQRINSMYMKRCHSELESVDPYGPGQLSFTPCYIPTDGVRGAFDYHLDIGRPAHAVFEDIEHMLKAYRWLDAATSSLYVQTAFLNAEAEPPMFGLLELRFDFERSGGLTTAIHVDTVSATAYPTFAHILLDGVWVILTIILLIRQCWTVWGNSQTSMYDPWVWVDWVTLFLTLMLVLNFNFIIWETTGVATAVAELPPAPVGDQVEPEALKKYHDLWVDVLDRVIFLTQWTEYHRLGLFWYTMVLTLQFFSVFRGQPKLAQLGKTLANAMEDLLHFLLLFVILFLNFAFSGFMLFGLNLDEWSTGAKAVTSTFQALSGYVDLASMYEMAPVSTVAWFTMFISTMIFVMLNLLLATIFDHYAIVKTRAGANTRIVTQIRMVFRDWWGRPKCTSSSYPSHSAVLEELICRSRLPDNVRDGIRGSVLGSKWARTERENHLFSGKLIDENGEGNPAVEMVGNDLRELIPNKYYVEHLQEECFAYCKKECDGEEMRMAQLRELVTLAETDVALMRARLADCQDNTGSNMRNLARRLAGLETLVHNKLSDLVDIAETAGVPAGPNTNPSRAAQAKAARARRAGPTMPKASDIIATFGRKNAMRDGGGASTKFRRRSMEEGDIEPMMEHVRDAQPPLSPKSPHVEGWDRSFRRAGITGKRLGPMTPYR